MASGSTKINKHTYKNLVPSGNFLQFAIEHGPVEIVSFPIKHKVMFHSYVGFPIKNGDFPIKHG